MKYTKEYIKKLDTETIDFCCRWLWDSLKRGRLTENLGRTKAQREYAHDSNDGFENAFDMLRVLKKYNTETKNCADEISLFDDDMKE